MKKSSKPLPLASLFVVLGLSPLMLQCAKDFEGEYEDPNKVEIISDKWNETDARKTAEEMIKSLMSRPWLDTYTKSHNGKQPMVIVGQVKNDTDEHINTVELAEFIQTELINSGKVRFLNKKERDDINKEIEYQISSGNVAADKAMKKGRQFGAEFMLSGTLSANVQKSPDGGLSTKRYQTVLTLTSFESAEIEWTDKYLIKKRFKQSSSSL